MATYNTILRQVAVSVNSLSGPTSAQLQTTYSTVPLTSSNFVSSIFPFTALVDKMLNGIARIITSVANDANHPYRAALVSQTAVLAYGDEVQTDSGGVPVIGSWGAVRDNATGEILSKANLSQVRAWVQNPGSMFLIPVYWWATDDVRIYHTVDGVILDVVAYTRPNADTLDLTDDMPLPDDATAACVHAALEECVRDDEFVAQASKFGEIYDKWVAQVESFSSVDMVANPVQKAA